MSDIKNLKYKIKYFNLKNNIEYYNLKNNIEYSDLKNRIEYPDLKNRIEYPDLKNNIKEQQGGSNLKAVACFNPNNESKIKGTVLFTQEENKVIIEINLSGLEPDHDHGFHVHEAGDLTDHCTSACAHFNPYNKTHGGPDDENRHVGDLGNLHADINGNAIYTMEDDVIKLYGDANIIGRALIIHRDTDDCGKGIGDKKEKSLITGNAGDRIACAVIGYSKYNFIKSP